MYVCLIYQWTVDGVTGHLGQNVLLSAAEQDNRDKDRALPLCRVQQEAHVPETI